MAKTVKANTVKTKVASAVDDVYDGTKIKELPFPLNVQKRAQMYIGPTDSNGIVTVLREILNNSVDEFLAGHCTHISIIRHSDVHFTIKDNGRGVPFDVIDGKNTLSKIFGSLHSGRNFEEKTVYSTGINGVGSSCSNALSKLFHVTSTRGKDQGEIVFNNGYQKSLEVRKIKAVSKAPFDKSSTEVEFHINTEFFDEDLEIDNDAIVTLIRETAYLNSGLNITYKDEVLNIHEKLNFSNGVQELLDTTVCKDSILKKSISLGSDIIKDVKVEVAFDYNNSFNSENIKSFCNTINTSEGGTHVTGFKRAISQKLLAYVTSKKLCKEKVTNDDIYCGLNAVVSVFVFNPKYTSQTKQCLKNNEVNGSAFAATNRAIDEWLNTNPADIKIIAAKIDLVAKSRIAQKRALDSVKKDANSNLLQSLAAPAKFEDCHSDDSTKTELLLVEGDSAGGSVNAARNKKYQALYKLRGKPLNTLGKSIIDARKNAEIDDICSILKCGTGKNFDIEKLKFGKIITLADSDDDGKHIELLLKTLFTSQFIDIVKAGRFYITVVPLYRVIKNNIENIFLNSQKDLDKFFGTEFSEYFEFKNEEGKTLPAKSRSSYVKKLREYRDTLEKVANKYSVLPHALETGFVQFYDQEEEAFSHPENVEMKELPNGDITISGFLDTGNEEMFVYISGDPEELVEDMVMLQDLYIEADEYSNIFNKKGVQVTESSLYNTINKTFESINKYCTVTRFKGLGEVNPEELETIAINPESRKIYRITLPDSDEEVEQIVNNFMGGNKTIDFRKEFISNIFKDVETV